LHLQRLDLAPGFLSIAEVRNEVLHLDPLLAAGYGIEGFVDCFEDRFVYHQSVVVDLDWLTAEIGWQDEGCDIRITLHFANEFELGDLAILIKVDLLENLV
jgi:hypothetical protein